jgi:hypothetical protein
VAQICDFFEKSQIYSQTKGVAQICDFFEKSQIYSQAMVPASLE